MDEKKKIADKICIFGVGQRGIGLYYFLKRKQIEVFCFCDNDKNKRGYVLDDVFCYLLEELHSDKSITYVIANKDYSDEIKEQLKQDGITKILLDKDLYNKLLPNSMSDGSLLEDIIEYYNGVLYDAFRRSEKK